MTRRALPAVLLAVLPAVSPAQEPPRFESGVEMVNVDVRVVDDRGAPVAGLPRDAFTLEEDGVPQAIESFQAIAAPEASAAGAPAVVARPSVSTNAAAPGRPARTLLVVVDDVHVSPANMLRVQAAVGRFVKGATAQGDRVTVASTGTSLWWSGRSPSSAADVAAFLKRLRGLRIANPTAPDYVSDWEAMRIHDGDQAVRGRVLNRLVSQGGQMDPPPPLPGPGETRNEAAEARRALQVAPGQGMVEARARAAYDAARDRQRATLRALLRLLGTASPSSRPTLLLVTEGFVFDPQMTEMRDLKAAANRANASIHFLDAAGLAAPPGSTSAESARDDALGLDVDNLSASFAEPVLGAQGAISLAADTGGTVWRANLDTALVRVAAQSRSLYALGYRSTNPKRDGKYRKLRVAVRGAGLHVQARRGYFAPGAVETPAPAPEAALAQALDAAIDQAEVPLRLAAYVREPVGEDVLVLLAAAVDVAAVVPEGAQASLDAEAVVTARDTAAQSRSRAHADVRLDADSRPRLAAAGMPIVMRLQLAPGAYQARLVVREATSGRSGRVIHDFQVPDPATFRISTPALDDAPPGPQGLPWSARRTFPTRGKLYVSYEVFGSSAGAEVKSGLRLKAHDGTLIADMPPFAITPDASGRLGRTLGVSLTRAEPGDYELTLTATDGATGDEARWTEPIVLTRAE